MLAGLEPEVVSATTMPELAALGHSCPVFLLRERDILHRGQKQTSIGGKVNLREQQMTFRELQPTFIYYYS